MIAGDEAGPLRVTRRGIVLALHVQPGARREGPAGLHGDRLRLRVAAPAVDGRANARVVELVAELFGLARSEVTIVSGETSRSKDVSLAGIDRDAARARVEGWIARPQR